MRIVIAGGSGFIGTRLTRHLLEAGHEVFLLTRAPSRLAGRLPRGVSALGWDGRSGEGWSQVLTASTAVVNLAGENIAGGAWTVNRRRRIRDSRVNAGIAVTEAVNRAPERPAVLVQASAVGFYGPLGRDFVDESAPLGRGFLAEVCAAWEDSTRAVETAGIRRCVIRSGVVLGPGGALARMLPAFRAFLGGPLGSGEQGLSWIHLDDEALAIVHLIENAGCSGVYNLTAPGAVDSAAFAGTLGRVLNRPALLRTPAFMLRALFGEMADEALLSGQFVRPARLLQSGYRFRHPELEGALRDILERGRPV